MNPTLNKITKLSLEIKKLTEEEMAFKSFIINTYLQRVYLLFPLFFIRQKIFWELLIERYKNNIFIDHFDKTFWDFSVNEILKKRFSIKRKKKKIKNFKSYLSRKKIIHN